MPCAPPEPAFGVQPLSALPHAPRYKKSTLPRAPVVPAHPSCLHPRDAGGFPLSLPIPGFPMCPITRQPRRGTHLPCLPGLSSPWHFPFPNPQHPTPASVSPSSRAEPRQPPPGALHCFKPTLPRRGLICSSNTLCNCSSPLPLPSQLLLLLKLEIATFKCFSEPPTGYNKNVAIGATRYKGL